MEQILNDFDSDRDQVFTKPAISKTVSNLPFVYILGRTDGAASYYGLLIYSEYIRDALEQKKFLKILSGKFVLSVKHSTTYDQYMEIHIELKKEIQANNLQTVLTKHIIQELKYRSAEFNRLSEAIGKKCDIRIILHPKGEAPYFEIGIKQKWIEK